MADERSALFPTAEGVTEVPLLGDEPEVTATTPADSSSPEPNRGRIVGLVLAGVAAIAVGLVAVAAFASDDDPPPTTVDPADLATEITTPPTLGPLEALPPPGPAVVEEPQSTTSQDRALFGRPPPPTYLEVPDSSLREIVRYDVADAVDRLDDDVARRSETRYELGAAGFVLDVTIERDPVRDRYQIVTESRGRQQVAIVDNATGTTYVNPGTDNRVEIPNAEIFEGSTATSVNEYFDRLLKGPVRPDSFVVAATRGRSLVSVPGVGAAREFVTNVDGDLIPEWQIYAFGPAFEFRPEERPRVLEYHVYVDEAGDVAQVDGVSTLGDVRQLVQHRLTLLDEPVPVELPTDTGQPDGAELPAATTTAGSTVGSDPPDGSAPTTAPVDDSG